MPIARVLRNGQITLPAQIRKALHLEQGDLLEVEIRDDMITLRPAVILSREEAKSKLTELIDRARAHNRDRDQGEIEREVAHAVEAVRRRKKSRS